MIARCIANTGAALPESYQDTDYGITSDTRYTLTVGECYVVLAVTSLLGYNFFYVLEDDSPDSPTLVPALLFEIVDGRLSRHWQYRQHLAGGRLQDFSYMLSFPEWDEGMFLENLIDGLEPEVSRFKEQVVLLQTEFALDSGSNGGSRASEGQE